jgi:hypothetical protein
MIRTFLLLSFLLIARVFGATGDVLSVTTEGYYAKITLEGMAANTGGAYAMGWDATNNPATSTPKIVFTVTSPEYSDTGTTSTSTRTVYGTKQLRKVYPNQAQWNEVASGSDLVISVALSSWIFDPDASITVNILADFYTGGPGNNAVTGLAVTNNSVDTWPYVLGGWNVVPFQKVGTSFDLAAGAFHYSGQQWRPVRAVKFTVTDGTTTVNQFVTTMTIDLSQGDATPIPEYRSTFSTAPFIQGATLTCNFIAYPWNGEASALLDTSTGTAAPSPNHGPITMVCDKTGGYGVTIALVDPSSGSDTGANTVYDSAAYNEGTAYKFATIARAAQAIKDYNTTNRSRGDVGAGRIRLAGGNHTWMGASLGAVYGTTPATWITVEPALSSSVDDVFITGTSGNTDISDRVKFSNVTITSSGTLSGIGAIWMDDCVINSNAVQLFPNSAVHWVTQCRIPQLVQGLRSYSVGNCAFAMVRGCDLTGMAARVHPYNFIGNFKSGTTPGNPQLIGEINGSTAPRPQSQIIAYNRIYGFDNGSSGAVNILKIGEYDANKPVRGVVLVQNIFERLGTGRAGSTFSGAAFTADTGYHNVLAWNNTFMGERQNLAYNNDATLRERKFWSVKNNFWFDTNTKDDTFEGQAVALGSWPFQWGVGFSGNELGGENNDFMNQFVGLSGRQSYFFYSAGTADDVFKVVDWRANDGVNPGTGNGDYTPLSTSPAYNLQYDQLIPYDIAGRLRASTDSAGAISTNPGTNAFPVVTITSPATGATTASPVTLTATATDAEDGTISGSVVWSSSINGTVGTGASISASLSPGTHTITATITDTSSDTDTDTITLIISTPSPTGRINANRVNATNPVRIQ